MKRRIKGGRQFAGRREPGRLGRRRALSVSSKALLKLSNRQRGRFLVQHRVAVGADRAKIAYRIDFVLLAELGQLLEMMDVDEPPPDLAVSFTKIEIAHRASGAVVVNAR